MAGYTGAAVNAWEAFCCVLFFRFFAGVRNGRNRRRIGAAMGVQALLCTLIGYGLQERYYIGIMAVNLTASLLMFYVFRVRYLTALVLSMFFWGLDAIAEYLARIAAERFLPLHDRYFRQMPGWAEHGFTVLAGSVLLLAGILLIGKIMKGKAFYVLTEKEWRILFLSTFITLVTFSGMAAKTRFYDGSFLCLALAVLAVDYVVYCLIDEIMRREIKQREDRAFRQRVKYETKMYRSISENLDCQRKRTHEFKNQMAVIHALAAGGQHEELNAKYREATGKGIAFALKVNDLSGLRLCDEDIVLILSNLLNNAMEACGHAEEKIIKLKFVLEGEQIVLSVKNSMASMPVVENGVFLTTKTIDAQEHGIGIRNVAETVEKYGGRYAVDFGGEGFLFSVLLDNPQTEPHE